MCVSYSILFYPGRSVKPVLMLQKRGARRGQGDIASIEARGKPHRSLSLNARRSASASICGGSFIDKFRFDSSSSRLSRRAHQAARPPRAACPAASRPKVFCVEKNQKPRKPKTADQTKTKTIFFPAVFCERNFVE